MKKLIVVADWAADSLSCQEIRSTIEGYVQNPLHTSISFVNSEPASIHTAFLIDQVVTTEERYGRPLDTIVFQGSDVVVENLEEGIKTRGILLIIRLKSGLHIIGPNSGFSFALIKPKIDAVFTYPNLPSTGSFRARDVISRVAAHLMDSEQDDLALEETHTHIIPEMQRYYVGHIDSFGNILTTIPESVISENLMYGNELEVTINGVTKTVEYTQSLFDGLVDRLVIYPGGSGVTDDPYVEISMYRDFTNTNSLTGAEVFNNPTPGTRIQLSFDKV